MTSRTLLSNLPISNDASTSAQTVQPQRLFSVNPAPSGNRSLFDAEVVATTTMVVQFDAFLAGTDNQYDNNDQYNKHDQ